MNRPRILVLADDLTGAAELAALGHLRGLRTALVGPEGDLPSGADTELVVVDSDSRLLPPEEASARVAALWKRLVPAPESLVFKKTDSVLRGNIAAESEALARALGRPSILLCPANPSRGRCISDGRYSIDGIPLHRTGFGLDPAHPAHTDEVLRLLPAAGLALQVLPACSARQPLPAAGLHVGSAASREETQDWAARALQDPGVLPAGGAEFFSAWLDGLGVRPAAQPSSCPAPGPHLLLSGSLAPSAVHFREELRNADAPVKTLPARREDELALDLVVGALGAALATRGRAVAATPEAAPGQDPALGEWLDHCCRVAVVRLCASSRFRHLLAEGGATAAQATQVLCWQNFSVAAVWSEGVVSLRPDIAPEILFTLKPGSYAWPAAIRDLFLANP